MNSNGTDHLKQKHILIVEDVDSNFEVMRVTLLSSGLIIDRAANGEEALEKFRGEINYDLIIMDIKLPGINGYEVTRIIRETDKKIPIIANTAYALAGEQERAIKAGCTAYFSKPTDYTELISTISSLLIDKKR
jgi:two-component system, cell cycle response regulator DivK